MSHCASPHFGEVPRDAVEIAETAVWTSAWSSWSSMSRGATSSSTTLLPPFYPTTDDPPEVERASALWSRCNEPGNEHWRSEARWLKEGWLPSLSETGATCLKSKNTWRTKRLQRLLAAARSARLDPNKSTPRAALGGCWRRLRWICSVTRRLGRRRRCFLPSIPKNRLRLSAFADRTASRRRGLGVR